MRKSKACVLVLFTSKYLYTYPIVVSSSTHSSRTRDAADHVDCLGTRACVRGEDSARGGKGGGVYIHAPLFFGAPVPESFEGMRWSLLRGVLAVLAVLAVVVEGNGATGGYIRIFCHPSSNVDQPSLSIRVYNDQPVLTIERLVQSLESKNQGFHGYRVVGLLEEVPANRPHVVPVQLARDDRATFETLIKKYQASAEDLELIIQLEEAPGLPRIKVLAPSPNEIFVCASASHCTYEVRLDVVVEETPDFVLGQHGSLCIVLEHLGTMRRQCIDTTDNLNIGLRGSGSHLISLSLVRIEEPPYGGGAAVEPITSPHGMKSFRVELLPPTQIERRPSRDEPVVVVVDSDGDISTDVPIIDPATVAYKTYVISLEKREDLWLRMKKEIAQKSPMLHKNSHVERVLAHDGASLDYAYLVAENIITQALADQLQKQEDDPGFKVEGVTLTKGAVGCALSHVDIWKKAAKSNMYTVVFEDDVRLHYNFDTRLSASMKHVPSNFSLFYMGTQYYTDRHAVKTFAWAEGVGATSTIQRILGNNYGTFAYIISPRGAMRLLDDVFPLTVQIDSYIIDQVQRTGSTFVAYTVDPPLVSELKTLHISDVQRLGGKKTASVKRKKKKRKKKKKTKKPG